MKKNLLTILFLILVLKESYSQPILNRIDSIAISNAKSVANSLLGYKNDTCTYLLFSITNQVMLVSKNNLTYKVFNGFNEFNVKTQKLDVSNLRVEEMYHSWIDKCFNKDICDPPYMYVGSDPILIKNLNSMTHTNYIYFVLFESGVKKCEFNVPLTVSVESNRKNWIPMKPNILKKLLRLMKPK